MTHKTRTPLTLGWEAARANALPALIIPAFMLALLIAYYTSHTALAILSQLAELKHARGILFVVVASVTAEAVIPELFLILSFNEDALATGICATCSLPSQSGTRWNTR